MNEIASNLQTDTEPEPPRRRSYSQLSLYRQCPEAFRWKYIERVPEQPAVWSIAGTAFHSCAEWYLAGQLGEQPGPSEIGDAWDRAWQQAYEETCERLPEAAERDVHKWRAANRGSENALWWSLNGPRMVENFVRWKQTEGQGLRVLELPDENGEGSVPALESRIQVNLGGVSVLAIPDAVVVDEYGQVDIVDYKTGKPPKDSLQLGVYAAALREAGIADPVWGLYFMARDVQLLPIDLAKHPHSRVVDLFVEFDERERAGDYRPTPGDHCKFCAFKPKCSFYRKDAA